MAARITKLMQLNVRTLLLFVALAAVSLAAYLQSTEEDRNTIAAARAYIVKDCGRECMQGSTVEMSRDPQRGSWFVTFHFKAERAPLPATMFPPPHTNTMCVEVRSGGACSSADPIMCN